MSKGCTLTPAYGRKYTSNKAIYDDLIKGKDFVLHDITSRWDGQYANITDLLDAGYEHIQLRYRVIESGIVDDRLVVVKVHPGVEGSKIVMRVDSMGETDEE